MTTTTPNWKSDINLKDKCGSCRHFIQRTNKGLLTARGNCERNNMYKQRTETCLKYSEEGRGGSEKTFLVEQKNWAHD